MWNDSIILMAVKTQLLVTWVSYVLLYAYEMWTIKKEDKRMLLAYEMRCCRNVLGVGWQERKTNESIKESVHRK